MPEIRDSPSFHKEILECVDRGLNALGPGINRVFYWHLENNLKITREEIPKRPEEVSKYLSFMFGVGSRVVENRIIHEIKIKFELEGLSEFASLSQAVQAASKSFLSRDPGVNKGNDE
ncbi:MAG: hypothetical protein ACYC7D_13495 [Nitrososphaerales archaeon]